MPKIVHRNKLFRVEESMVMFRDRKVKNYRIVEGDTVVVLPITSSGKIILERQYRVGMPKRVYEVPSGHIDKGELPIDAALRELEEETGFRATTMEYLTSFYSCPGMISKREDLFIAKGLLQGKTAFDDDEDIQIREMSVDECMGFITSGKIMDAKTIIAVLYYIHNYRKYGARAH